MALAPAERALLLAAPQIGPRLLSLIEAAGFHSVAQMRAAGAAGVMDAVHALGAHRALANRVKALERAMAAAAAAGDGSEQIRAPRQVGSAARAGHRGGARSAAEGSVPVFLLQTLEPGCASPA